jgi:response regulator of citrate/malate metabolism
MPGELLLWSALRSYGRMYRASQHRAENRKRLKELLQAAATQHWSIPQIAEASTLSATTVRKYIK